MLSEELSALGCPDYDIRPVRRVLVCYSEDERDALEPIHQQFAEHADFAARWLDGDTVRQLDSRLSAEIRAGLLVEGNRSLDARAFNHAIIEGAIRYGARLMVANVLGVSPHPSGGYAVHTDRRSLSCDALVFASGPWVADIRQWLGLNLPVEPVKGEMLRLRVPGDSITHDFTHGMISLYRRADGEVWVGVTRDACGFDEHPSADGQKQLREQAARIMPSIARAELLEHLASLRPMAPGGLPVIGPAPGIEGVYIANGGGIKGMLTCVAVGHAIRDLVLQGRTDLPVGDFTLREAE